MQSSSGTKKLFEMTRVINAIDASVDISEVLKALVDTIASEITSADLVGYFAKDEAGIYRGVVGNKLPVDIKTLLIDPTQETFVRDIITKRRLEYISDTSTALDRLDPQKIELMHIQSILGMPVIIDDEVIGLVFVHDFGKPMSLSTNQIELTEAFVNMASVAIKNVRMFDQTQNLVRQQQLLLDAANAMSKSLSAHEVLSSCFHFMGEAIDSRDVAIHIYNEADQSFTPYHISEQSRYSEMDWKQRHKMGIRITREEDKLFDEIVRYQKPIAIYDVFNDDRPNHEACKIFGIQSMLLIPLVAKGTMFGDVAIISVGQQRCYTKDEIEFCQSIADVTATALSNALYAEDLDGLVRQRTAELQHANVKLEEYVQELRDLDILKSDFIASLSHELRTPITAIKGTIEILQRGILGAVNPEQLGLLKTSESATTRLLNQVNELLDFSKLESGSFKLNYTVENLNHVLNEALQIVKPLTDNKEQELTVHIETDTEVQIDKQRILQILINILSNAQKFTPEHGHITVRSFSGTNEFVIEISDTGMGIPSDKQRNIFSKFYQVNNVVSGTGLGLSIAKQLVEMHGGNISFHSEEGKGTTFTFTIPKEPIQ